MLIRGSFLFCFCQFCLQLFYFLPEPFVVQKQVAEGISLRAVSPFLLKLVQDTLGSAEDGRIDPVNYSLFSGIALTFACKYLSEITRLLGGWPRLALLERAKMGLSSQLLLPEPLLPGCPA